MFPVHPDRHGVEVALKHDHMPILTAAMLLLGLQASVVENQFVLHKLEETLCGKRIFTHIF